MGRVEKGIFLTVLAVFLISLGMMFFQSLEDTDTPKVYHVSVLLDGAGEDYWRSFRQGVDRAARESNADVRFVTRYEEDTARAQVEALKQEWEGETDGAVIIPVDGGLLTAALQDARSDLKVVVAGPGIDSDKISCYVSADNVEMGRRLGQAIAGSGAGSCAVVRTTASGGAADQRLEGLTAELDEQGIPWEVLGSGDALPQEGAIAALTPGEAEILCTQAGAAGRVYGVGASNRLLHYLEEGAAQALVIQSDYDAGYLSVLRLVGAMQGLAQNDVVLDCYTVTAENMFTDPVDQILFPVG